MLESLHLFCCCFVDPQKLLPEQFVLFLDGRIGQVLIVCCFEQMALIQCFPMARPSDFYGSAYLCGDGSTLGSWFFLDYRLYLLLEAVPITLDIDAFYNISMPLICSKTPRSRSDSITELLLPMDLLRELVGGPKNRYKEFGYNLDLTYITARVIAMAFPASGIEKLYRNSVDSIREFFQNAHQNKYITVNISGRNIEEEKLQNVISYDWEDHKAPPFDTLFLICDEVAQFLEEDPDRIAVFHCNHGKGRTGTIICCFFLFLGVFESAPEVMQFYALRRFEKEGYGVTQPCQIKYIEYFLQLLKHPNLYPKVYSLTEIKFLGEFSFSDPYIKIWRMGGQQLVYSSKDEGQKFYETSQSGLSLVTKQKFLLAGDIVIEIKENKTIGTNSLINYVFNTAFLDNHQLRIPLSQLSPLGRQKLGNFGPSFEVLISLHPVCPCAEKPEASSCQTCVIAMKQQYLKWSRIKSVLKRRKDYIPQGQELVYGNPQLK